MKYIILLVMWTFSWVNWMKTFKGWAKSKSTSRDGKGMMWVVDTLVLGDFSLKVLGENNMLLQLWAVFRI